MAAVMKKLAIDYTNLLKESRKNQMSQTGHVVPLPFSHKHNHS